MNVAMLPLSEADVFMKIKVFDVEEPFAGVGPTKVIADMWGQRHLRSRN